MADDGFDRALSAARSGVEWGLDALYRAHQPRILRYLRAQAGDEAEDVAAETWIDAARNLRGFVGDEDQFRAWLFTIARRRLVDHRRRKRRRPQVRSFVAEGVEQAVPSAESQALSGRLGDEAARRIVDCLPPDQAEVVLLRVVAGLDVEAVVAATGRRPGTVRVLQHRGLRRLAREIRLDL